MMAVGYISYLSYVASTYQLDVVRANAGQVKPLIKSQTKLTLDQFPFPYAYRPL